MGTAHLLFVLTACGILSQSFISIQRQSTETIEPSESRKQGENHDYCVIRNSNAVRLGKHVDSNHRTYHASSYFVTTSSTTLVIEEKSCWQLLTSARGSFIISKRAFGLLRLGPHPFLEDILFQFSPNSVRAVCAIYKPRNNQPPNRPCFKIAKLTATWGIHSLKNPTMYESKDGQGN